MILACSATSTLPSKTGLWVFNLYNFSIFKHTISVYNKDGLFEVLLVLDNSALFVEMNRDFSSDTKQNTLQKEREKAGPYAPFFGRHGTQVYESFLLIRNRLCE